MLTADDASYDFDAHFLRALVVSAVVTIINVNFPRIKRSCWQALVGGGGEDIDIVSINPSGYSSKNATY